MPHLQLENNTVKGKFPTNYVEMVGHLSHYFSLGTKKDLPGIKIFLIKVNLSVLLTPFITQQLFHIIRNNW